MASQNVNIFIQAFDRATRGFRKVQSSGSRMRDDLEKQGAGISRSFTGFGSVMNASILKVIATVGVLVLAFKAVSATFKQFITQGVQGNAQMEQFSVTLATTTRDLDKANKMLEEAIKFAAETPFEIPEVVQATVALSNYGIKAQEVITIVGDMAAVMGKPLSQAVEAIADAQTGELERLKEFGITKRMLIDEGLRVNSRGSIEDMKSLNDALFSIMRQRFGGGMKLMSQTFIGVVSNLKDFWGTLLRDLSKPAFEVIKKTLQDVLAMLQKMKEDGSLQRWTDRVGNAIAGMIKTLLVIPKVFTLIITSFIRFSKRLADWDFFVKSVIMVTKFIVLSFRTMFDFIADLIVAFAKTAWNPISLAAHAMITGIVNSFDLLMVSLLVGFKFVALGIIGVLNNIILVMNAISAQASKLIPGWNIPEIPDLGDPFGTIGEEFESLNTRMTERTDNLGQNWNETWKKTGQVFEEQTRIMAIEWKNATEEMRKNAEDTIFPLFEEGIGDELSEQWRQLANELNEKVTPAAIDFNLTQNATIKKGRDILEQDKKRAKLQKEFNKQRLASEQNLNREILRLTLGETALKVAELQNLKNRYIQLGLDRETIETFFNLKLDGIHAERFSKTQELSDQINELTMSDTDLRLIQIEKEKQAWIQQGADRMQVEELTALRRAQVQTEADSKIREEGMFTIQTLTNGWGTFIGFAKRGFEILRGSSRETWQEMIADMIEWITSLIAQFLIAKGLEQTRRAEGKKTHAEFMRNNAEELTALAAKFALSGDIVRAAAAGALAGISLARATAADVEAKALDNAAKKSIALGLAVQTGGVIASEALQQWGQRASDARKRQEELQRGAEDLSLDGRDIDRMLATPQTALTTLSNQPIPVEIVRTRGLLEPELNTTAITSFPDVPTAPAAVGVGSQGGFVFVQNNNFEGLVNFDNEEALRELARKLQPLNEEFEETFTLQTV